MMPVTHGNPLVSSIMALSLIALFISVMFLTWAQITHTVLKWVWLAVGLLIALGTGIGYLLAPLLGG